MSIGVPFEKGRAKTGGRRAGARNRLSSSFLEALAADFEQHGEQVIKICRVEKPNEYLKIVASLMPKELEISDNRLAELSDSELETFIAKLRAQLRGAIVKDLGDGESATTH